MSLFQLFPNFWYRKTTSSLQIYSISTTQKTGKIPFFNRYKCIRRILVFKAIATAGSGGSTAKVQIFLYNTIFGFATKGV